MEDGFPSLEVGFAISTEGSFETLRQLQAAMDSTEGRIVAEAANIERATSGMLKLDTATASMTSFGNAATRELQTAAREMSRVEKAGEAMVRQLERQNASFGQTREQLRAMKAEAAATAAEQQGLTELAQRIRAEEAALFDKEYAAVRAASQAAKAAAEDRAEAELAAARARIEAERQVIAQLRERAAVEAALERSTGVGRLSATDNGASFSALAARAAEEEARAKDLASAATKRLADEHARLVAAVRGSQAAQEADAAAAERLRMATDPLYAATKRLNAEIAESTRLYYSGATAPAEYARQQQVLVGQLREVERAHEAASTATGRLGGAARLSRGDMINLGYQINDVVVSLVSGQKPLMVFAQQGAQIGQIAASSGVGLMGMARSIGALLLPFAPIIAATAVAAAGFALFTRAVNDVDTTEMVNSLGLTRAEIKRLEDVSVTTGDVVKATFQVMAERVGLDLGNVKQFFADAMDFLTIAGRDTLAGLYSMFAGTFRAISVMTQGIVNGKGVGDILGDAGSVYKETFLEARSELTKFGADVNKQLAANKLADLRKQADEIKKDRAAQAPKVDRHSEALAREAAATEAQIRNLYALAEAYGVSGAAALVAEARVKAESAAIKRRGDVEAAVERQIRLAIAERVKDAAQGTAAMREQALRQEQINTLIAEGNTPAEHAADLLRDRIADLPLLAALEAAQLVRGKEGIAATEAAAAALEEQRAARERLTQAEQRAQLLAARSSGTDRMAELREELRLIEATEEVRARALATLRAEQEVRRQGWGGQEAADYVQLMGDLAVQTVENARAQAEFNEQLSLAIDLAEEFGDMLERSLGKAGGLLGDLLSGSVGGRTSSGVLGGLLSSGGKPLIDPILFKQGVEDALAPLRRTLNQLISSLEGTFGEQGSLPRALGRIIGNAALGSAAGGVTGGSSLGGSIGGVIGGELGKSFLTSGLSAISKSLGAAAGPLGAIAGGLVGSVLGGIFGGGEGRSGSTRIIGGVIAGRQGTNSGNLAASNQLAGSVIEQFSQILQQLGATGYTGSPTVSIGKRDDNFRVDPTGRGMTKLNNGAIDFGQNEQAAIQYAIRNMLGDVQLIGVSPTALNMLNRAPDLATGLEQVQRFQAAMAELKERTDPAGAALEALDKEMAALRTSFMEAGASTQELADLEKLYQQKRADVIKEGNAAALELERDRKNLMIRLYQARGEDAAALAAQREIEMAATDEALRALLAQVHAAEDAAAAQAKAVQEAEEAAAAAEQLRRAWSSVGDSIMDEVKRIRGLAGTATGGGFAALMGQFNAATAAARGGDQAAAESLPGLSQALLAAAADAARSRQELERVQAQTAASLEATYAAIEQWRGQPTTQQATEALLAAVSASQAANAPSPANDDMAAEIRALREEVGKLRSENSAGHAATAGNTGRIARKLDDVTAASGGDAINVANAA